MISNLSAAESKEGNDKGSDGFVKDFKEYTPVAA